VNVPLTPLDFLERARRLFGPLEAAVEGERRVTYAELADRCHRLAHLLRSLGVARGDRVAYLSGNTLELLEAYFGVVLAGAVLTPLNIRLAPAEMDVILSDCQASLLAIHPAMASVGQRLTAPVPRLVLGHDYDAQLASMPERLVDPGPIDEDATCELFYTSGSTGRPKGAMLTHRALATHAVDSALSLGLTHRDVVLHTIPLFHVNGWGTPHYVTALGARHVLLERFDARAVLRLIEAERVTRCSLVPTMVTALLNHPDLAGGDLSSLVQVTVGGAPPGPALLAELEMALGGRCEVICGYGLTEASPQVTKAVTLRSHDALPDNEQRRRRATTGLPNVGVDARVLGPGDAEVAWDGTATGEICVRSNHVMAGYWQRPDETAETLRGGWLRTGDLATVDPEGYITIVDRKKDIIVSGGENVSTVEVEQALCAHPAVLEAAVVGMAHERWGEVPRAFVVLRDDTGPVTAHELIAWTRERLAHFKAPQRVEIVADLPKGGTGKVQKLVLRQRPVD
jgi:fatty-acyl-CoA synthase